MQLRRLVTLLIAVGILMIVSLLMPGGVRLNVMCGAESDISPLCSPGGALISDPAGKAELLSAWFDSKQSRDIVELLQTCHPRPAFCGIAFRVREDERHLLNLALNGTWCGPVWLLPYVIFRRLLLFLPQN